MRLFTKLIAVTCALTGGGFLFNYFSSSQAPKIVKKPRIKTATEEYDDWIKNRTCVAGDKDEDC